MWMGNGAKAEGTTFGRRGSSEAASKESGLTMGGKTNKELVSDNGLSKQGSPKMVSANGLPRHAPQTTGHRAGLWPWLWPRLWPRWPPRPPWVNGHSLGSFQGWTMVIIDI